MIFKSEIKIFEQLGLETYTPMIIPNSDPDLRSISVRNNSPSLPKKVIEKLNNFSFWTEEWDLEIQKIISAYFDIVYVALNSYLIPLHQSLIHFDKLIIARAFGREVPYSYEDFLLMRPELKLADLINRNNKFFFVPVFEEILEIEPSYLIKQHEVIGLPLPDDWFKFENSWDGSSSDRIIFLCPNINDSTYYKSLYLRFKFHFSEFNHLIFGKQHSRVEDPSVLEYMTEVELINLYQTSKLLVYLSPEPRHLHYTPIESMLVGLPVVYLKDSLLSKIINFGNNSNGVDFGECSDIHEMVRKVQYLLSNSETSRIQLVRMKKIQREAAINWRSELFIPKWVNFLTRQDIPVRHLNS